MGNAASCEEAVAVAEVPHEEPAEEEEAAEEHVREIKLETAPVDPRFPTTNQARHCFVKYNEAHRCAAERGAGAPECARLAREYRAICPTEWLERWAEAREAGTWQGKY